MQWYSLTDGAADATHNMATDLALLDLAAEREVGFVRTYAWSPFALSFGANEPANKRYDRGEITRRGLAVVRRPTGGRAVWHAEELTYAIAAPEGALGTLAESYRRIHEVLAEALASLGGAVTIAAKATPTPDLDSGACFASPVGGELTSQLGKVVGSAQLRERGAFLQHGSILLGNRQEVVAELTKGTPPAVEAAALADILGRAIAADEVATAVARSSTNAFGALSTLDPGLATAVEVRMAMHRPRFLDEAWTWRR